MGQPEDPLAWYRLPQSQILSDPQLAQLVRSQNRKGNDERAFGDCQTTLKGVYLLRFSPPAVLYS